MSDATTIAIVRHGQTDWNAAGRYQGSSNTLLNETGRGQAREAAAWLRATFPDAPWSLVRHSPLERAAETGRIIAEAFGVDELRHLPSLVERDWAAAEGLTLEQCRERWPKLATLGEYQAREYFPGVEPPSLVTDRGVHALATIAAQHPGRHVIATAHGTVLRYALGRVFDMAWNYIPNAGTAVVRAWHDEGLHVELLDANYDVHRPDHLSAEGDPSA